MRENARVPRQPTIVFVHAPPDDEALLTAGTMARAADEGLRVVLVVATDGAAGLTDAALAPHLALHRRAELASSADILGVHRLVSLDYPDSGLHGEVPGSFAHEDRFAIARRIGEVLDDEDAALVVGYDPSGGYGHPDHLQVHRAVRAATVLARRPPVLFEATLPREPIARAVRAAHALHLTPGDFDPAAFDHAWTPSRDITHRVDVRRYLAQKTAALRAHASQATADGTTRTLAVLTRVPGPVRSLLLGTEYYVRISGTGRPSNTASTRQTTSEAS